MATPALLAAFAAHTAAPSWTPADLTGLTAWYDATVGVSDTSGAVDTWADQSGNGYTMSASGAARPTTNSRTLNSLNVIDFNGSDGAMRNASVSISQPSTFFVVVINDAASSNYVFDGDNAGRQALGINLLGGSKWDIYAGTGVTSSSAATGNLNFTALFNGTSSQFWLNGSSLGTGNAGSNSLSALRLGHNNNTSVFLDGAIAEFVACSGDRTASRGDWETYTLAKWGV